MIITHSTLSPPSAKTAPLHCRFCGQWFVGPVSLIGTGCPKNRLVGGSDVFQANPEDIEGAF